MIPLSISSIYIFGILNIEGILSVNFLLIFDLNECVILVEYKNVILFIWLFNRRLDPSCILLCMYIKEDRIEKNCFKNQTELLSHRDTYRI